MNAILSAPLRTSTNAWPMVPASRRLRPRAGRMPPGLPSACLRLLADFAAERGIEPQRLLVGTALTPAQLEQPELRIGVEDLSRVVLKTIELTRSPGIGLELGLRAQPTLHGALGYALLSSPSIRAALELLLRYAPLRQPLVGFRMSTEGGSVVLELQDLQELGPLRAMFHESLLVGLARLLGMLLGERMPTCELWFDFPEPAYCAAQRERLPPLRHGMPASQLRLPAAMLGCRPLMADPVALRAAIEACERERALLAAASLSQRVVAQLQAAPQGYPPLKTVAAHFCVSARTLKRHLSEAGTSYQQLLDEQRRREALRLMARPDLGMDDISERLGYSDPSSFTRAFRRWCGQSPSQVRQQLHGATASVRRRRV
ncbi:MAG TPA: AraC family transcriptional regulator ligand-binding domain-containing protein [Solimonas sp.]|nr:AraC family transcriptional regulator ligand-binding domain-containing protein [Solimonas sp.]